MTPPTWLKALIGAALLVGVMGFVFAVVRPGSPLPKAISDFMLVLTFVALLLYVYYTYVLAREASALSAAITLTQTPTDPLHILVHVTNSSKVSLQCYANLHATVKGKPVNLLGFYGGDSAFDVQPFSVVHGHFDLRDLLAKAGENEHQMIATIAAQDKTGLYLDLEFWYAPAGTRRTFHNPRQPHYFDFERRVLVADF